MSVMSLFGLCVVAGALAGPSIIFSILECGHEAVAKSLRNRPSWSSKKPKILAEDFWCLPLGNLNTCQALYSNSEEEASVEIGFSHVFVPVNCVHISC